jgi:hypothetical protein
MRRSWSTMAVAGFVAGIFAAMSGAGAQQPAGQPASEGHPHKWQVIDKSLYDVLQDGFDLAAVVYDTAPTGPQTETPDVHYFLQKGADLVRCDFRKRDTTSYYWCYALTQPAAK